MDIYSEQLVRKDRDGFYFIKKIGILAGAFILGLALLYFILLFMAQFVILNKLS